MSRAKKSLLHVLLAGEVQSWVPCDVQVKLIFGLYAPSNIDLRLPASCFLILPNTRRIFIVSGCPVPGMKNSSVNKAGRPAD